MSWLKFDPTWAAHVRIKRLCRTIADEGGLAYLLRVWGVAMADGSSDVDLETLEDDVEWTGGEGVLISALVRLGFVDHEGALGGWYISAAGDFLQVAEKERLRREKATDRMRRHRGKRDAKKASRDAKEASPNARPASRDAQNSVTNAQERKKERKTDQEPQPAAGAFHAYGDKQIDTFVAEWTRRDVETSRQHRKHQHGGFFSGVDSDRGEMAMRARLVMYRDRQGPADKVGPALDAFWDWWDTAGKKLKRDAWRPTPPQLASVLEPYLVERGMVDRMTFLRRQAAMGAP